VVEGIESGGLGLYLDVDGVCAGDEGRGGENFCSF